MTRETKIGLLVGIGIILLIWIIISDHLSTTNQTNANPSQARQISSFQPDDKDAARAGATGGEAAAGAEAMAARGNSDGGVEARKLGSRSGGASDEGAGDRERLPRPGEVRKSEEPKKRDLELMPARKTVERTDESKAEARSDEGARAAAESEVQKQLRRIQEQLRAESEARKKLEAERDGRLKEREREREREFIELRKRTLRSGDEERLAGGSSATTTTIHTVKDNETLWDIAVLHLKDGTKWTAIKAANPNKVYGESTVRPGAKLVIPSLETGDRRAEIEARANERMAVGEREREREETRGDATPETIVTKSGDTLSKIAHQHLGKGKYWYQIYELNKNVLPSADEVPVGVRLRLPKIEDKRETARRAAERDPGPEPAPPGGGNTYRVQEGDTLWKIAARRLGSGTRWEEIHALNRDRIPNPDRVEPGTLLILPR